MKWIIFDFDGTLADTMDITYLIYTEVAAEFGYPVLSREEIIAMSHEPILQRLRKQKVRLYQIPKLMKAFLTKYVNVVETVPLFPNMFTVMKKLEEEGYLLAILSSNHHSIISRFIDTHELPHFQWVQDQASIFGKAKSIQRALKKQQIAKEDVLYVGDELRDIEACKKIGISIAAVTWGYDSKELLLQGEPTFLANTPKDLLEIVKKL